MEGRLYQPNSKVERAHYLEQFVQVLALSKQYWRKYLLSKTAKLLGGKKVNEPYIFLNLKENFSETIWYIEFNFSEITEIVMVFQYSI